MARVKTDTVTFVVTKEAEWYLARAEGLSIFTEAKSLEELKRNIKEATELHLGEGENERYGLPPQPKIRLVYRFHETL